MVQTILFIIIFVSYITYVLIRERKILASISDSWYGHGMKGDVFFTLFCFSLGFTVMTLADKEIYFALSGVGLLFVGAASMFKDGGLTRTIHFAGALFAIICGFFGLYYEYGTYLGGALWVSFTAYAYLFNIKNTIWWVEVVAFILVAYFLVIEHLI